MSEMERLRAGIDRQDERILAAAAARRELARQLGQVKARLGLPVVQPAREARLEERWRRRALELGLPAEQALALLDLLLVAGRGVLGSG